MIYQRKLILDAIRVGITTAIPGALDNSEDPAAIPEGRLPAFSLAMSPVSSEPTGMGKDAPLQVTDEVSISLWDAGAPGLRTRLYDLGDTVDTAVAASTSTASLMVHWIRRTGTEFEVSTGTKRIGRLDLTFNTFYIAPVGGVPVDGFDAGFASGFQKT